MSGARTRLWKLLASDRYHRHVYEDLRKTGIVTVGRETYGVPHILRFRNDATRLEIGSFTSIGPGVTFILGGNHPLDRLTVFPFRERLGLQGAGTDGYPQSRGDISVGSDVWIAAGVTVVSGVRIGHGAVVAAGAVVTREVRPYAIAAGVPAREIGRRFNDGDAERLLSLAWWRWPDEVLGGAVGILCDPNHSVDDLQALARGAGLE
jgi:acetyltransferase-like isoleucine patch superfamily enzyme